ncbi:HlyC/CorC family transporter [Frigidibacter sp. ROC022]|uniref:HlyC/CorC family transporter n=1 Tax=Frigidibacter sp. ROC022 TaxID=2971796 RepID=UPI00215B371E|nr:HlyC/CorC family transporter [Frigidibacter sp. ROC022]MCR8723577.1 HlyC/CorC family transporter [Frigidibacter sp. ROC022]
MPADLILDTAFWITATGIFILLFASAFFSGSETALTASSRAKLRIQADKGSAGAKKALDLTDDSERLIGSILLGNNIVNILAAALATSLLTRLFGESGVALATLGMTILVLIFGEVLPKTYAITNPERASSMVAYPISLVVLIASPVVSAVRLLVRGLLYLFGVRTDPDSQILAVREEIVGAITLGHHEGAVEKEDRDRLLGALDLGDRMVEEVMRHRSEIEMLDVTLPTQELLERCLNSSHTRLPLYRDDPDNIVGVIHAKDFLRAMYAERRDAPSDADMFEGFDILEVATKPYFVPETTTLDDQMRQFLKRKSHFALVVDEYGTLQGLITLEDILEEIVGEITDEFDVEAPPMLKRADDGSVTIDGGMTIRDFNRATDWSLPDDEANTVAGLVIHEAQAIPAQGQVFLFHGFRFEVLTREANRITRIKVRPMVERGEAL